MRCHEFEIEIRPSGEVQVHIQGVKGPGCQQYQKLFERILHSEAEAELTNEYYAPPEQVEIRIDQQAELER